MAWTVVLVLTVLTLAVVHLILNKSLDSQKQGLKVFLTMIVFAVLILLAGIMKVIIGAKATGTQLTNLSILATTQLILTIAMFSFFLLYFLVSYTKGLFVAVKDSKSERSAMDWGELQ